MKVQFKINIESDYEYIFLIKLIVHNPLPYINKIGNQNSIYFYA